MEEDLTSDSGHTIQDTNDVLLNWKLYNFLTNVALII